MSAARTSRGSVDRSLSVYLRREVYPHAEGPRRQLDAARIGGSGLRSLDDLRAIETMTLADAADGQAFLLRPRREDLLRTGSPATVARVAWAGTWGRWSAYLRKSYEPRYRPVHYFDAQGVPVGASVRDLVRLSGLGYRWLDGVRVSQEDSVVLVGGAGGGVEAWELSAATRRRGVALVVVDDASRAGPLRPTVLAGSAEALDAALSRGGWPDLRLVVPIGRETPPAVPEGVLVRRAWAPPGARAAWYECAPGGRDAGWHTNADAEVLEADDAGEVLWTALGWSGTVFLRLRTNMRAELDPAACPACGSASPRLHELPGSPTLGRFLAADARVADYRLTETGADVLAARPGANVRLKTEAAAVAPGTELRTVPKRQWSVGG
ncbi:MAG TPA: hypothetical protein VNB24_00245 [Acidimicrobiales bacterium]|nr:hypothetical protein [Acidimicrobiales bacterium]